MQDAVKGGRRQGRQRKRWEDIREWTGLEFGKSQRAEQNREKWSKLVVELKWRPNDPRGYGIDEGNVKVKARINPQCRSKLR